MTISYFTVGAVLEEQAGDSDAGERGGTVEQAPLSPLLRAAIDAFDEAGPDAAFEQGLAVIVDGLAKGGSLSGTLKDRERVTIDQDRCRSATHSLQQSHVDNIPPLSTASDARSSPLRAFSCPALASKPHGRARPLWRPSGAPAAASARGPWRGPRAGLVRLALAAVFTFCLAQMR